MPLWSVNLDIVDFEPSRRLEIAITQSFCFHKVDSKWGRSAQHIQMQAIKSCMHFAFVTKKMSYNKRSE